MIFLITADYLDTGEFQCDVDIFLRFVQTISKLSVFVVIGSSIESPQRLLLAFCPKILEVVKTCDWYFRFYMNAKTSAASPRARTLRATWWNFHYHIYIITDRMRSMVEGTVFTGVCHSFCPWGVSFLSSSWGRWVGAWGGGGGGDCLV